MQLSGSAYLKLCLGLTALAVSLVAALNYVADPCGIYHFGKSWDWIPSRPEILELAFIHKAHASETAKADVLLIGNSRVAQGLDPHGPGVPPNGYNLGLPGSSTYEQWRYLQNAAAAHMPSTVVLGIDPEAFGASRKSAADFSEDRLSLLPDGKPTPAFDRATADLGVSLLSYSTLQMSLKTLRAPKDSHLKFLDGFEADAPKYFEQMDLARSVLEANEKWVTNYQSFDFRDKNGRMPQMDAFSNIIAFCATNHIHLIVFVHPLHAVMQDKLMENWELYCDWMRALAARTTPLTSATPIEFWDFSGYNNMSTEPFPAANQKYNSMHYYWEGSHYRKIVGDMVLRRIFTGTGPASFGQLVTSATVDQDLQRLLAEKEAWHEHGQAVLIETAPSNVSQVASPDSK